MIRLIYLFIAIFISMIGYTIHHSVFWCIIDYIFWPIALIKFIFCHEITLSVIKASFAWFLT